MARQLQLQIATGNRLWPWGRGGSGSGHGMNVLTHKSNFHESNCGFLAPLFTLIDITVFTEVIFSVALSLI